jgi:hypothetical protein
MTKSSTIPSGFQINRKTNSTPALTFTCTAFLPALGFAELLAPGAGDAAGGGAGALIFIT